MRQLEEWIVAATFVAELFMACLAGGVAESVALRCCCVHVAKAGYVPIGIRWRAFSRRKRGTVFHQRSLPLGSTASTQLAVVACYRCELLKQNGAAQRIAWRQLVGPAQIPCNTLQLFTYVRLRD